MKILKSIFNFYIDSSIHVALSVCTLTWITLKQLNLNHDHDLLYFVFLATIAAYNFIRYFEDLKAFKNANGNTSYAVKIVSLCAFFLAIFYAFQLKLITVVIAAGLGAITVLYAVPLRYGKDALKPQRNLREISGLKIYVIAFVWTNVTVLLPLCNNDPFVDADVLITWIQRFLYVIVLMLPFEIRDLSHDHLKLATIPQKLGVKNSKTIGLLLLLLFFLLEYFKDELGSRSIFIMLIVTVITGLFIAFSKKTQSKYYSAFWVESLPIQWGLLLFMFS